MKGHFKVVDPDKIEMELTIKLNIHQWKMFRDQIDGAWPGCDINSDITRMINQADAHFYPESEAL